MPANNYYLGRDPIETLGDSPRYWYGIRRNQDGELFVVRSDQLIDKGAYFLNSPGDPIENFEEFISGVDYFDGIKEDHEPEHDNMVYSQFRWDDRSIFYYVDSDGMLVQRITQGYTYPSGISS